MKILRIASRQSPLALKQTELVSLALKKQNPGLNIKIIPIVTEGDKNLSQSLAKIGGKGLFLKELENALLNNEADLAIHSLKDAPVELAEPFDLISVLQREDPSDALISQNNLRLEQLPLSAIVGTSSLRRGIQLKLIRPDLNIKSLRGNINTRLKKLNSGDYDAIVLATAGLKRLNLQDQISETFKTTQLIPAVGQGTLCAEFRAEDHAIKAQLQHIQISSVESCAQAERTVTHELHADCHSPVAVYAHIDKQQLKLTAWVANSKGSSTLNGSIVGDEGQAVELGRALASKLIEQGALTLLKS